MAIIRCSAEEAERYRRRDCDKGLFQSAERINLSRIITCNGSCFRGLCLKLLYSLARGMSVVNVLEWYNIRFACDEWRVLGASR